MLTDARTIIEKAEMLLNDLNSTWWTEFELLGWLNDGQLEVVIAAPNANAVTENFTCVVGVKQTAPASTLRVIEFIRNRGTSGTADGNAIRDIKRKALDNFMPGWGTVTASNPSSATVIHTMYDADDNSQVFYVWPPQPSSGFGIIELCRSVIPTKITDTAPGTKITISDHYAKALLDYLVYKARKKDSDYGNTPKAMAFYQSFASAVGIKFTMDAQAKGMS
jgi:hypothetical protein